MEVFIRRGKPINNTYPIDLGTYTGTQGSPHVLESMHMALEKFFLERGKMLIPKRLKIGFCIFLIIPNPRLSQQ